MIARNRRLNRRIFLVLMTFGSALLGGVPLLERMADWHCRATSETLNDDRDTASKVRRRCAQHWPSALTYAARLKTYGGKASSCNAARKVVEILGRVPQGGDHHNERSASLDQGLDRGVSAFKGLRSRRHETPWGTHVRFESSALTQSG